MLVVSDASPLGVLENAAARDIISLPEALAELQQTDFRIAQGIVDGALVRDRMRRGLS